MTRTTTPATELLNAREVADILKISVPQVYVLARTKTLASVKIGHRTVRFTPHDVTTYIEQNRTPARQ